MADEKLTVGQEVRVFDRNGERAGQPEGGWPGKVVKVGRTLAQITYPGACKAEAFRLGDGRRNDAYGGQWFMTLDEVALAERERAAKRILREHRVTLEPGCSLSLEQIEAIAAITAPGEEG